jgi:hypothetical protein
MRGKEYFESADWNGDDVCDPSRYAFGERAIIFLSWVWDKTIGRAYRELQNYRRFRQAEKTWKKHKELRSELAKSFEEDIR